MSTAGYKIWAWGTPVGKGVTGAHFVGIAGVAKAASAQDPFIVANELVCNALARALLLPCPPGATLDRAGIPYFFSLDFNIAGHPLPPADASLVASSFPRLSWGVILFDVLVMNFDRKEDNLAHDTSTDTVQIFDHSHAFMHGGTGDIGTILADHDGNLCIGNNCLGKEISTDDGLDFWADRIGKLPDFYIEDTISSAVSFGIPANKKDDLIAFMKKRRSEISSIARANMGSFPNVPLVTP